MLKQDKEDLIAFASGDRGHLAQVVQSLNAREPGHFEDRPLSAKPVRQHLAGLVSLWNDNPVPGARDWVLQFIADAQIADAQVRPMVQAALADKGCRFLPTVLYTMGPALFEDCGDLLLALANHPDHEVRWRVAYFISKVRNRSESMVRAIHLLKLDRYDTTQVYVRACGVS
ncbi:MAG: hypothetical protein V4679_08565 [Pseudomonadota bacterium]